ncbi:hypothetical protein K4F52_000017 [Lecanicillium sp. MT-2017a]|nr:hypothetical protein K4F52_000017 [Lecanicillium sp. MT-2017a]
MHLNTVSTEDTGITESTYELVAGTDSESQDGNYTGSMSESVGSLDNHRPDDVVSLAGTEHTFDDESVVDISDLQPVPMHATVAYDDDGGEDHGDDGSSDEASEDETDSDGSSNESLQYADNSLQTPSILTPECSRVIQPPRGRAGGIFGKAKWLSNLVDREARSTNYLAQAATAAIPGLFFAFLFALLSPMLYPSAETGLTTVVSTVPPPLTHTSSLPSALAGKSTSSPTNAPTTGVGLIPLPNSAADEWLFSSKPTVSFAPHGKHDVLIHVRQDVKDVWMSKNCLTVTVMRKDQKIDVTMVPVEDGILVQFPRWDAYGIVNLSVQATCRPKTQKEVKVHFGKGIIVEAFERTKNLAYDLSDLVPAAAYEAERRLSGIKQSLQTTSHSVWKTLASHSGIANQIGASGLDLSEWLGTSPSQIWSMAAKASKQVTEEAKRVSHNTKVLQIQTQLKIRLLNAQISARSWWLKVSGPEEAYNEYSHKAQEFLRKKKEAAAMFLSGGGKAPDKGCKGYMCSSTRRGCA